MSLFTISLSLCKFKPIINVEEFILLKFRIYVGEKA